MELFTTPNYTNKSAKELYDYMKQKYCKQFTCAEDIKFYEDYDFDPLYLDEELDRFLLIICQDMYDDKETIKEILDK